jgi:hypothetical protein
VDEAHIRYQKQAKGKERSGRRIPGGRALLRPFPGRKLGLHGHVVVEYYGVVPVAQ